MLSATLGILLQMWFALRIYTGDLRFQVDDDLTSLQLLHEVYARHRRPQDTVFRVHTCPMDTMDSDLLPFNGFRLEQMVVRPQRMRNWMVFRVQEPYDNVYRGCCRCNDLARRSR